MRILLCSKMADEIENCKTARLRDHRRNALSSAEIWSLWRPVHLLHPRGRNCLGAQLRREVLAQAIPDHRRRVAVGEMDQQDVSDILKEVGVLLKLHQMRMPVLARSAQQALVLRPSVLLAIQKGHLGDQQLHLEQLWRLRLQEHREGSVTCGARQATHKIQSK